MKLKTKLKKSAMLALSATMLMTSVPAQAGVFDTKAYKLFNVYERDYYSKDNKLDKAEVAGWNAIVFKEITLNKKQFKAGDKLKLKITIDDSKMAETIEKYRKYGKACYSNSEDKVETLTITFRSALSEQEIEKTICSYGKRNSDGTVTFRVNLSIKDGMKSGDWIISQIVVNDLGEDGVTAVLENREYTNDDRYPDLSGGHFKVVGTKADLQAPSYKRFEVKKTGKDTYVTKWAISDKSKADCYCKIDIGGIFLENVYSRKNGVYSVKWKEENLSDSYDIARDIWGNYRLIYLSQKYYVSPKNRLEKSKIEVKKVTPSSKTVTSKQKDKISLNMKWTKFTPKYVMLEYRAPYGSATKCVMMKATNKSKTKWTGTFNPDGTTHKGTWRLYRIHVKGKNSKGKTVTTIINNKSVVKSQLQEKDYLKADLTGADIKVK